MTCCVTPQLMANAVRALAMDAVQKAKSGHPGMPWAWPILRLPCGQNICATIPPIRSGWP